MSTNISTTTAIQNIPTYNTTTKVSFTGISAYGTISSISATIKSFNGASAPTIGVASYVGLNTTTCTATFLISGLSAGIAVVSGIAIDDVFAASTEATVQINSTSTEATYQSATSSSYNIIGGAPNALTTLSRFSPATDYLESHIFSSGAADTITFKPLDASPGPVAFGISGRATDNTENVTRTVVLMQGNLVIATRSAILTTSNSTVGGTTTTGETSSITDRSALYIRYSDI